MHSHNIGAYTGALANSTGLAKVNIKPFLFSFLLLPFPLAPSCFSFVPLVSRSSLSIRSFAISFLFLFFRSLLSRSPLSLACGEGKKGQDRVPCLCCAAPVLRELCWLANRRCIINYISFPESWNQTGTITLSFVLRSHG